MQLSSDRIIDAVVIVPGLLGSALHDTSTDTPLWGLTPRLLLEAFRVPSWRRRLGLDEDEQRGDYGRVEPTGLLEVAAFLPGLGGLEPYRRLISRVLGRVAHPDALLEFPYDWRLPVEHNSRRLAVAAGSHLERWQRHPAHAAMAALEPEGRRGRLVFIAHSMGGLLVRALAVVPGGSKVRAQTRATITLGTPFMGAAKAAVVLATGPRWPLGKEALRSMPGLYDLLPTYRCLYDGEQQVRRLTPDEVRAWGGDAEVAERAADLQQRLAGVDLIGHRQVIGTGRTTPTTLRPSKDGLRDEPYAFRPDGQGFVQDAEGRLFRDFRHGDGTVPRNSAELLRESGIADVQSHGALPRSASVLNICDSVLGERPQGPPLAAGLGEPFTVDFPEVLPARRPWTVTITGRTRIRCEVEGISSRTLRDLPVRSSGSARSPVLVAEGPPLGEGLYRLTVDADSGSPMTEVVLVREQDPEST